MDQDICFSSTINSTGRCIISSDLIAWVCVCVWLTKVSIVGLG